MKTLRGVGVLRLDPKSEINGLQRHQHPRLNDLTTTNTNRCVASAGENLVVIFGLESEGICDSVQAPPGGLSLALARRSLLDVSGNWLVMQLLTSNKPVLYLNEHTNSKHELI